MYQPALVEIMAIVSQAGGRIYGSLLYETNAQSCHKEMYGSYAKIDDMVNGIDRQAKIDKLVEAFTKMKDICYELGYLRRMLDRSTIRLPRDPSWKDFIKAVEAHRQAYPGVISSTAVAELQELYNTWAPKVQRSDKKMRKAPLKEWLGY